MQDEGILEQEKIDNQENIVEECVKAENCDLNEFCPIIFDLSFMGSMKYAEINSTLNQIRLSIGYLRKRPVKCFKLACCNVSPEIYEILTRKGSNSWKLGLYESEINELGFLGNREIIMLSPDADEILEEVDIEHCAYIIGGLVDKTVKKKETYSKAQNFGWKCKRLPIKETIWQKIDPYRMKQVLNINTVIEILQLKAEGQSWEQSLLTSIPKRWQKK
jgi:tRNA (guanine9-N1)-methyltransferase